VGLAATGSKTLTRHIAKATAQELKAVGVNLILGPVLDVMGDSHTKVLGPRSFGENPQEVSALGSQFVLGCRDAGLATCGKHFPSFEKLELTHTAATSPPINGSLRHLSQTSLAPFHDAICQNIDAILVGDVAVTSSEMSATHACLSERIVDGLLRKEMGFKGVVVSECLELSLSRDIGIQGAAVMGVRAGCDLVLVCRSLSLQTEALQGLELGIEGGTLEATKVEAAVSRILALKSRCTSWDLALNPTGTQGLKLLRVSHRELSKTAYNKSITVVRDSKGVLPLTSKMTKDRPILLLTPMITPLPSSMYHSSGGNIPETRSSELVFQKFGATLGTHTSTKVIHTSYSAHGVRPRHEDLIDQAAAVVIITASANTNKYQRAFSKHATLLCSQKQHLSGPKPCIVVAVTSPYDFATDPSIDPYICTYDYTECALRSLVGILCGEAQAKGKLPKGVVQAEPEGFRQQWLVEKYNPDRDSTSLTNLLNLIRAGPEAGSIGLDYLSADGLVYQYSDVKTHHFVVRNSSTKDLYGFCAAYYVENNATGYLGLLVVDPKRRKQSIGGSLHTRTIQSLEQISGIVTIELGFPIPIALPGVPSSGETQGSLHEWFGHRGWIFDSFATQSRALFQVPPDWKAPDGLSHSLSRPDVKYEMVHGGQDHAVGILEHIRSIALPPVELVYHSVLTEKANTGIIRAKNIHDGTMIGMWRLICFRTLL
jgi:beta-N-acetylhexosaminidase